MNKKLINQYITHLRRGFSETSFPPCDFKELEEFAEKENLIEKIREAKRDSQKFWESCAINALNDKWENFNYELWMFIMKNRFGWSDKPIQIEEPKERIVEVQLKLDNNSDIPDEINSYNTCS